MSAPDPASSWVVRAARADDIDVLVDLAHSVGSGMTTFPPDGRAIADKLESSLATFAGHAEPAVAQYLLVMEDMAEGKVVGVAAVYPSVGWPFGFFSYKVSRLVQRSRSLDRRVEIELLTLANDYSGATEVGTLVLRPELRGTGAARFLARSRYMLIAAFPELFAPRVMAELRGWQDDAGSSPFWDAVGARFFHMEFADADRLSAVDGAEFIAELMPKHPIYTAMLPEPARHAIGRPHRSSTPAMAMLLDENFRYENHVDVFDAGPQVHVERDRIRTVVDSRRAQLQPVAYAGDQPAMISTLDLQNFRVTRAGASLDGSRATLGLESQRALELDDGAELQICPLRATSSSGSAQTGTLSMIAAPG